LNGDQVEDIRKKSRSQKGPWSDPVFYGEMARKTCARLHSKQLPSSTDLEMTLSRDDDLYDLPPIDDQPRRRVPSPGSARGVLDQFAAGDDQPRRVAAPPRDVTPPRPNPDVVPPPDVWPEGRDGDDLDDLDPDPAPVAPETPPSAPPGGEPPEHGEPDAAPATRPAPSDAPAAPARPVAGPPVNEATYRAFVDSVLAKATSGRAIDEWWTSQGQRKMRNACGLTRDITDQIGARVQARIDALGGIEP
jgi:hypothetical protein